MTDRRLGVILADSHAFVREALAMWLGGLPEVAWVAQTRDADEALRLALARCPRLVLLEARAPGRAAFDVAELLTRRCPAARIALLADTWSDGDIERALAVGVSGLITRAETLETLRAALHRVAGGATYFSPEVAARQLFAPGTPRPLNGTGATRRSLLTPREVEVLRHLAHGHSKKQIAELAHLSERTVNRHCANLMAKLDIHDRVALARYAFREGLCEP